MAFRLSSLRFGLPVRFGAAALVFAALPALSANDARAQTGLSQADCTQQGWTVAGTGTSAKCSIPLRDGGANINGCFFSGTAEPLCSAVFGTVSFPPKPQTEPPPPYVFNCGAGQPGAQNTNGATECTCDEGALMDSASGTCACPSGMMHFGGACFPEKFAEAANNCMREGWTALLTGGGKCEIPLLLGDGGGSPDGCFFSGNFEPQCEDVFGPDFAFPTDMDDGARYVYNCGTRMHPRTANPDGQTQCGCAVGAEDDGSGGCMCVTADGWIADSVSGECVCPAGEANFNGTCYTAAIAEAANKCRDKNWTASAADNGKCEIPTKDIATDADYAECHFSGSDAPQCANAFGADLNFPQKPQTGSPRYVYNCGVKMSPRAANTVGATQCECAVGAASDGSGGCMCATVAGWEETPGGECVCPMGEAPHEGVCVQSVIAAGAAACEAAGWTASTAGVGKDAVGRCEIPSHTGGTGVGESYTECRFTGSGVPQCADIFGENFAFPENMNDNASYVYNCGPGAPETVNTQGARQCVCGQGAFPKVNICACGQGDEAYQGACYPAELVAALRKCEEQNWTAIAARRSCEIPVVDAQDGSRQNQCFFTRGTSLSCYRIFGEDLVFPPRPETVSFGTVYHHNCDPDGTTGLIPALANTIQVVACGCTEGDTRVGSTNTGGEDNLETGGVCVAPEVVEAAKDCLAKGWKLSQEGGGKCLIPLASDGAQYDGCFLGGETAPLCSVVFDEGLPTSPGPNPPLHIFGCEEAQGGVPGAECVCQAGQVSFLGECRNAAELDGVNKCRRGGWTVVVDENKNAKCQIPLFSKGTLSAECHISGDGEPQCADAFGDDFAFPENMDDGASYVYNCGRLMRPETTNLNGATQCRCAAGARELGNGACECPSDAYPAKEVCIPRVGDLDREYLTPEVLCRALGGEPRDEDEGEICAGLDASGTFCVLGSSDAFPCRGLFKHLRACNLAHHRPALNPFICGARCQQNEIARGSACAPESQIFK